MILDYINKKLDSLSKNKFRNSFHLKEKDFRYIEEKGLDKIKEHAYDFINKRIKVKLINDGKQTPMRGHPVFIAQHACACCCRSCIEKWHHIPNAKELSKDEIDYIVDIMIAWINREISNKGSN